ncbi:MAG TPA: hypothetical protein VF658_20565 [Pyrinomonadaceae bacterium]|jgi:hypothetical protein
MKLRKLLTRNAVALLAFVVGVAAVGAARIFRRVEAGKTAKVRVEMRVPEAPPVSTPVHVAVPVPTPVESLEDWDPPESPPHSARVLETGEFHGDEVKARTGERWLGLYLTNKGSFLIDSILTVAIVKDEMVDSDDSHAKTGKRVSVNHQPIPILLVKGAKGLQPGPVSTVFNGTLHLPTTMAVEFPLGGSVYSLDVVTKDTSREPYISFSDAKLVLTKDDETKQVLYDLGGKGGPAEAYWQLLWAGDMDGDNKLDLYVQVSYHYNVSLKKLFLSSQAKKGKLVREVGEFHTVGC